MSRNGCWHAGGSPLSSTERVRRGTAQGEPRCRHLCLSCTCWGERKLLKCNSCLTSVGALIWKTLPIDLRTVCCAFLKRFSCQNDEKIACVGAQKCKFVNTSFDSGLCSALFMSCHKSFPVKGAAAECRSSGELGVGWG